MAIIELNNIRVSYETKKNKVDAVKDTTIHIEKGDIFGIIGYSGAGKSTIVRTINLLQKPSAGEVKVNGKVLLKRELMVRIKLKLRRQSSVKNVKKSE